MRTGEAAVAGGTRPVGRRRFAAFLVTNGTAAAVNVASGTALAAMSPYWVSVVLSYAAGMATAYSLSRAYVFAASGRSVRLELARYALVNAVTLTQVVLVSLALEAWVFPWLGFTWHAGTLAHAVGVGSPVLLSYHGHRTFTFSAARPPVRAVGTHDGATDECDVACP